MNDFIKKINSINKLNTSETSELVAITHVKSFSKGDTILKIDQINKELYFINSGLVKLSFYKEDKEFILKFFSEGNFCAALDSYVTQTPSLYSITAIEETHLLAVDYQQLDVLAKKYHAIERVFRKIVSMATVNMMHRISEMLETNGTERYEKFLKENSPLINRIRLGDLSGYLGISQVSLSRIRAKK
ncbi:Crp/Fnr family transcriptional regulator [Aquimarina hainanensis]|uniref:Crp/Fnr family transcriptional regulator n=1 Tax=Aquimarina hainanensis TaxID=1578017 RepID=A0ABW5NAQ6_9FLAO